jgi:hypothetical protein
MRRGSCVAIINPEAVKIKACAIVYIIVAHIYSAIAIIGIQGVIIGIARRALQYVIANHFNLVVVIAIQSIVIIALYIIIVEFIIHLRSGRRSIVIDCIRPK